MVPTVKLPEGATCQEASVASVSVFVPCGQRATTLVLSERGRRVYLMCAACADHNTRNRGAVLLAQEEA